MVSRLSEDDILDSIPPRLNRGILETIMKKRVFGRKLGRDTDSRKALLRSLIRALVVSGKVKTTKAKAKAVQGDIDRLITLAKKGGISQRRNALRRLANDREIVNNIFDKVAKIFKARSGGFTRIVPLVPRKGDMAAMVRIEWVENENISTKR